ncbi:serine hydrolase domain-containing protein [Microbacterium sp. TNHR37B]|uniref:serine hydrolase domain-containing protein n=1 Tax=Microbacterium sp. TNHR37B TaxID=1775956 RepID=UPI0007B299CB|nr:serine hydrolase domain-containing protein [Microbacterium sp. TNHR37B]KZE89711.1 D-alanyl-D-alanine carboxypeptidase [Microbacterium sp. TNHR37B]
MTHLDGSVSVHRHTAAPLTGRLDHRFQRLARRRGALGAPQVALWAGGLDYTFGDQSTPFHAASIGKLFTGVVVLQLVQSGSLRLDERIDRLLPASLLRGLFTAGRDAPAIGELLQHFSGAADYFEGRRRTSVRAAAMAEPQREWTPSDLLAFARDNLHPVGVPGETFHYSDTGFVLLGLAVEHLTGQSYHDAVTSRIIHPLGLDRTFLPRLTSPRAGRSDLAPCFSGRDDLSRTPALSCGWAGGGIASTPGDLIRFSRALHEGALLNDDHVAVMRRVRGKVRAGIHYGAAMMELRYDGFSPLLRGLPRPVGHLGSLGTSLFYDPRNKAHLAMNFHSRGELPRLIRTSIAVTHELNRRLRA